MNKVTFLEKLTQNNDSKILHLCIEHMLNKIYKDDDTFTNEEIIQLFSNFKNYHLYLNDFAGTIYNRYGSHVNSIYIQMCEYLNIEVDNKYTLDHVITKLEKQTPELLINLTNEDIQNQTIIHFDEKLEDIENSIHYNSNKKEFEPRVNKLYENISLVKRVLGIK